MSCHSSISTSFHDGQDGQSGKVLAFGPVLGAESIRKRFLSSLPFPIPFGLVRERLEASQIRPINRSIRTFGGEGRLAIDRQPELRSPVGDDTIFIGRVGR